MVRMNTHLCDLDQWPFCSVQQLKPDLVVAKVACLQGETAASRHVDPVPDQNILNAAAGIKTVQRSARECPWKLQSGYCTFEALFVAQQLCPQAID
jgi:hypothetical protein